MIITVVSEIDTTITDYAILYSMSRALVVQFIDKIMRNVLNSFNFSFSYNLEICSVEYDIKDEPSHYLLGYLIWYAHMVAIYMVLVAKSLEVVWQVQWQEPLAH